ncbi:unnamed protein product [Ilex paraguariensis]|uniref:Auxin-responsive protein n=1 Tax=Ilex paraguariensis TaxID=185542 RepID=A0ABC8UAC4_9AQUA
MNVLLLLLLTKNNFIARFAGTVVGIEDIDRIRWPGSEWRSLKVQWDATAKMLVHPERVSPWSIEPIGITKKKCKAIVPHPKRARPFDTRAAALVKDGSMKRSVECPSQRQLGVLQGQEIRTVGTQIHGESTQSSSPHFTPQPHPGWGQMQQLGLENQLPFRIHQAFRPQPDNTIAFPGGAPPNWRVANSWSSTFSSCGTHNNSEASNVNSNSSASQDWKASEEKDVTEAARVKPNGSGNCLLFGVNICNNHSELPSLQIESTSELTSLCSVPLAVSQLRISETIHISEKLESISASLPEKPCGNCCSRTCTKVVKYGTALGRSVHLAHFDGYIELICELDKMFNFEGALLDGSSDWHVTYKDGEGNMMLLGDFPWPVFQVMVRKLFICPKEDVDKVVKYGTALGRSVHLAHFDGYIELICELDKMFNFEGALLDGSSDWHVTYKDGEGNMMLLGDFPWPVFQVMVRKLFICPKEDVDKVDLSLSK